MRIYARAAVTAAVVFASFAMYITPGSASTYTIRVYARSAHWVQAPYAASANHPLTLTVTGNGTCLSGGHPDCPVGDPKGAGRRCRDIGQPNGPAGGFPYGRLAGRLGKHGKPFAVGKHKTVSGTGRLYLVYNDCGGDYADNAGHFDVKIQK